MKKIVFSGCYDSYLEFKSSGVKCTFTEAEDGKEYVIVLFTSRHELFASAALLERLSAACRTYAVLMRGHRIPQPDGGGGASVLSSSDTAFLVAYLTNSTRKGVCMDAGISRNSYKARVEKIMRTLRIETEDALRLWALARFSL